MKKKSNESLQLLDPQQALRSYLDALLSDVPDDQYEQLEAISAEAPISQVKLDNETLRVGRTVRIQELPITPGSLDVATTNSQHENQNIDICDEATPGATGESIPAADLPEWTRSEFQSLSFKVAGVTLATPLVKLNGIVELTEDIAELPGYAPWVMGILTNRGQKVQVVDLAQIIMPEGNRVDPGPVKDRAHYVILINNGSFGLAADSLSQVLTLQPEDVRWRTGHSKRPWLAGMVIDQMCAILDIDCLTGQLANGLKIPVKDN